MCVADLYTGNGSDPRISLVCMRACITHAQLFRTFKFVLPTGYVYESDLIREDAEQLVTSGVTGTEAIR